jgi:hypothetical protein
VALSQRIGSTTGGVSATIINSVVREQPEEEPQAHFILRGKVEGAPQPRSRSTRHRPSVAFEPYLSRCPHLRVEITGSIILFKNTLRFPYACIVLQSDDLPPRPHESPA